MFSKEAELLDVEFESIRYIVYFDFLGFSEIVNKGFLKEVVDAFLEVEAFVNSILDGFKKIKYKGKQISPVKGNFLFSDTLILYSGDDLSENLAPLVNVASLLIGYLLGKGFPTRCVIHLGSLFVGKDSIKRDIFLGTGIVETFNLEKKMNWCGGILHPDLLHPTSPLESEIAELVASHDLLNYEVPLKDGEVKEYMCLGWPKFYKGNFKKGKGNIRPDMISKTNPPLKWPVEEKIRNTEKFYEYFSSKK